MIVLRALGTAEIETDATTLTPSQEIVFAAALYLILEGRKPVSRTRVASLLWPCVSDKARAHRLRQTILQLKKVKFCVTANRDSVQASQQEIRTDFEGLGQLDLGTISGTGHAKFLPGYSPNFSEPFRDWVDGQREKSHATLIRRLVAELNTARAKGDWVSCDALARDCLELDPYNESAVLARAEASAMRGGKVRAVAILDQYAAEVGSQNPDLRLSASVLRRRITEGLPERSAIELRESAFVGREQEMKTLVTQLVAARRGNGGACVIEGDAGIGKSRLASELMKYAVLEGVQTTRTSCRRSDLDRPLSAFVDLVPKLSGLRGALGCSQETLSILKRLTEFDGRVSTNVNSIEDSSSVYGKVRAALFDLIDAIADEQPVLIAIDDVQWLDQSSLRLFSELVPWIQNQKVFFVLTKRPSAPGGSNRAWQEDLKTITLLPLQAQFAEAIIAEILRGGSRPTSPLLIQRLLSVGEGNPLFLQELSNYWLETGQQTGFPLSVTGIVDDRLARLSQEALQALQACAILGVNASIERVEGVLELKSHLLLSAVQELSTAGMLGTGDATSSDSSLQLRVRHDLIATAAVSRLATAALSFLHRRAGIVLEKENLGDGTRTAILWACAFHWRHAGERERAFLAARTCAEHLLEVGLPQDAVQAFERALEYCVTDQQRVLVLSRLAVSLQMNGQWERSKHVLKHLRQVQAKVSPNATAHDDDEFALFEARWRISLENSDLLSDLKVCVGHQEASVAHRVGCGLLGLKVATELSRPDAMKELYLVMEPLLGDPIIPTVTRLEVQMVYHATCGDIQQAERATDQLLAVARSERNPLVVSRALGNAGVAYRLVGRKEDAESIFLEVLDHAIAHGLVSKIAFATLGLVRVYLAAGDISKARSAMTKLEALTDGDQDLHRVADCLYLRARLAFEECNIAEAAQQYSVLAGQSSPSQSVNRRAAVLALGVRIGIEQQVSARSLLPMLRELELAHMKTRASGWQDFEAHALALGLRSCGELERGLRVLVEYTTQFRREPWAIPDYLSDLMQELRDSYAVSATRKMEPLSGVR